MALEIGIKAPSFTTDTDSGEKVTLDDFLGQWIILYFYPKDNTSGCTKEACSFRDSMSEIADLNTIVLGVSPDSAKSHKGFKEKNALNFTLLSDPTKDICNLYHVMAEKSMYGKKYIGVERSTYIIDENGIIRYVFKKVKVDGHIAEVKQALSDLKNNR